MLMASTGVLALWVCRLITGSTARPSQKGRQGLVDGAGDPLRRRNSRPVIHNLFQIADVDSGVIRWVNADLVTHILGAEWHRLLWVDH